MNRLKTIVTVVLLVAAVFARAGNSYVYLGDTLHKLFYCSNNQVFSADRDTLLYFQKGNIFFTGETDSRDNIYLLTTAMDVGSDKLEMLYEKDSRRPAYSFGNNKFYLGSDENEEFRDRNELLHVQRYKKWMSFYSSSNDSLLAFYAADSLPSSVAVIVAYTLAKKFDLEKKLNVKQSSLPFSDAPFATLKPVEGNQTVNEWIWDGKTLRPRWNVDQKLVWTFDGRILKPMYSSNIYDQYEWDGENFKPEWRTDKDQEWSWDGRQFKPVWSTDWSTQYIIEDNAVKPWSGVHPEKEWMMSGDIPVPVLILVISGIARPY